MPDITMCRNHACPMREECYRYTAKPSDFQMYATFVPKGGKCDCFWPIKNTA